MIKLSIENADLVPSTIFITAKSDKPDDIKFAADHMVIPMNLDNSESKEIARKMLKAVVLPSKLEILDTSIREPVTHMYGRFPVPNKARIMQILYSNIKPTYFCTQAIYNAQDAPAFGYRRREVLANDEKDFDKTLESMVKEPQ